MTSPTRKPTTTTPQAPPSPTMQRQAGTSGTAADARQQTTESLLTPQRGTPLTRAASPLVRASSPSGRVATLEELRSRFPHQTEVLAVSLLNVDHPVQRPRNMSNARKYLRTAGGWSPMLAGVLDVSLRSDGSYWVMDGQHRVEMAKLESITTVKCEVYTGLSRDLEGLFFRMKNVLQSKPTALTVWQIGLESHDPDISKVAAILAKSGLHIAGAEDATRHNPQAVQAVTALDEIYRKGGANWLDVVLYFVTNAFPADRDATRSVFLRGVFYFLREFGRDVQYKDLIVKLRQGNYTARKVLQEGSVYVKLSTPAQVVEALMAVYNFRRRKGERMLTHKRAQPTAELGATGASAPTTA